MGVLKNARHEKFAQELAKGNTAADAYTSAGYKADGHSAESAASRLLSNVEIQGRIVELQERGAERAAVTVESLIAEAEAARVLAMSIDQPSAAIAAVKEKGVLSGKRVERSEHGLPGEFDNLDADQLRDFIRTEAAALGFGGKALAALNGKGGVH